MAIDLELGGCAVGIAAFAKMTGVEFHVEGPVELFAHSAARKGRALGWAPARNGAQSDAIGTNAKGQMPDRRGCLGEHEIARLSFRWNT